MTAIRTQLLTTLEGTHAELVRLTGSLTDNVLDFHPGPEEWSIREILAHLVDDEMFITRMRLARIAKEEHPTLVPHDEKKWYSHRNTARDAISDLLHDFAVQRAASLNILAFLTDAQWERTAYHPEEGEMTAESWVQHWAEHDIVHLRQIESNIAAYESQRQ